MTGNAWSKYIYFIRLKFSKKDRNDRNDRNDRTPSHEVSTFYLDRPIFYLDYMTNRPTFYLDHKTNKNDV